MRARARPLVKRVGILLFHRSRYEGPLDKFKRDTDSCTIYSSSRDVLIGKDFAFVSGSISKLKSRLAAYGQPVWIYFVISFSLPLSRYLLLSHSRRIECGARVRVLRRVFAKRRNTDGEYDRNAPVAILRFAREPQYLNIRNIARARALSFVSPGHRRHFRALGALFFPPSLPPVPTRYTIEIYFLPISAPFSPTRRVRGARGTHYYSHRREMCDNTDKKRERARVPATRVRNARHRLISRAILDDPEWRGSDASVNRDEQNAEIAPGSFY